MRNYSRCLYVAGIALIAGAGASAAGILSVVLVFPGGALDPFFADWHQWLPLVLTGLVGGAAGCAFAVLFEHRRQVETECELRESERKYRRIFEHILDVYYRSDAEGRLVMVSPSALGLLGYSSTDEMIGENIAETFYYNPGDRETFISDLKKTGEVRNYEVALKHRDGSPVFVETSSHLVYDDEGNPAGIEGVIRDITEHKKADDALKESEERYKTLVETSPNGIVMTDLEGVILYASPKANAMYAGGAGALEGISGFDIIAPCDRERARAHMEKTLEQGTSDNVDYILRRKDGTEYYAELSIAVIRDRNGKPAAFMGIIEDVSQRKKAEDALKKSGERFRRLFEHSNDAVFIHDTRGKIADVNRKACEMLGYEYAELVEIPVPKLHPEETQERSRKELKKIEHTGTVRFESVFQRRDGTHVDVEISARIIDEETGLVQGIVRDITERKKAEQEQRDLEARLHRANKMEALGTLAGGVAHDLNNVLWGLVSYPDVMLADLSDDDPLRKQVLKIRKAGEKAVSIVQDLLTLARRGVPAVEVININDIISDFLDSPECHDLKGQYRQVEWNIHLDRDIPDIAGSSVNISKTVMNLVLNSLEALNGEGSVAIATACAKTEETIKGYENIPPGEYALLRISDTGEGIAPQNMERIFEPFFTTKVMKRSGTGLGMAVVWGTVKDHKGFIDIETGPEGTEFRLYFPVTRKKRTQEDRNNDGDAQDVKGNSERVLVVDDMPEQRELLALMLKQLGYSAETAESGEKAVEFIKDRSADLIILDMNMEPGMNGFETAEKIREICPGQRCLLASGIEEAEMSQKAAELGIETCISKPYRLKTLGPVIRNELEKKRNSME